MNFKENLSNADWKEWIEECHITEEQLEKLKTKHTSYLMESVHDMRGKYIGMKYRITFFQKDEIVDCIELQAYGVDLNLGQKELRNIYKNFNICNDIMDKIDEYCNDGTYPERPTWTEFMQAYIKVWEEGKKRFRKGGSKN